MQVKELDILAGFETFDLQALESMNFIDRMDFKYTFPKAILPDILLKIKPYYNVLAINDFRYTDYVTDYFDTRDFSFYRKHHNGQLNRFKARVREYVQSKMHYLEVKYKNNKNWTSKYREKISADEHAVTSKFAKLTGEEVEKKLRVTYRRITLLAKDGSEKVTVDIDLQFEGNAIRKNFEDLVIVEFKSKSRKRHYFRQIIKELGYREKGMSKYCFGITQIYTHLKTNNFKPLIREIINQTHYEFEHS